MSEQASERADEWARARPKRAARSVAKARAVRANERAEERVAQYSKRQFYSHNCVERIRGNKLFTRIAREKRERRTVLQSASPFFVLLFRFWLMAAEKEIPVARLRERVKGSIPLFFLIDSLSSVLILYFSIIKNERVRVKCDWKCWNDALFFGFFIFLVNPGGTFNNHHGHRFAMIKFNKQNLCFIYFNLVPSF